jgi:hypothetical protein
VLVRQAHEPLVGEPVEPTDRRSVAYQKMTILNPCAVEPDNGGRLNEGVAYCPTVSIRVS